MVVFLHRRIFKGKKFAMGLIFPIFNVKIPKDNNFCIIAKINDNNQAIEALIKKYVNINKAGGN